MKAFFKQNWWFVVLGLLIIFQLSYAFSQFFPFWKIVNLLLPVFGGILVWRYESKHENSEKNVDRDNAFRELSDMVSEQADVLEEYEKIFDSQLVELPCVCGGNTFKGLFSPNVENIVECEKCKNKYRVTVSYDSVLISEPLNLNQKFDELVGKID